MRSFFAEGVFETEDGEKLSLVCDFYTIDVVESITGENWDDIIPQLIDPPRSLGIRVLYGLLRKRHEGITLDEVAAISYDKNSIALWAVMGDVVRRAINLPEEPGEQQAKGENPTGRRGRSRSSVKNG